MSMKSDPAFAQATTLLGDCPDCSGGECTMNCSSSVRCTQSEWIAASISAGVFPSKASAEQVRAYLASLSSAKGAPISDWSWWVGSDETVSEDGLYDLYEAGARDDAIGWAECHVAEGERFHIIEARTRALQGDDEFMPFVDRRNAMSFRVNSDGVAVEVAPHG